MKNIEEIPPERKFITPEILSGAIGTCCMLFDAFSMYWTGVIGSGGLLVLGFFAGLVAWGALLLSIILVVIYGERRHTAQILTSVVLSAILCIQIVKAPSHLYYPFLDLGIKQRVNACGGVDQLQKWALAQLENQKSGEIIEYSQDILPSFVSCLDATVLMREHPAKMILIDWGGGFHRWGIRIESSQNPTVFGYPCEITCTHYWRPGMFSSQVAQ